MIKKRHRFGRAGLWMAIVGLASRIALASCFLSGVCAAATSVNEVEVLNVSFDRSLFSGVNENDAVAALKVWTKHFTEAQGLDIEVHISSYESRRELDDLLAGGQWDLMFMNTLRYLQTEPTLRDTITPQFVAALDDGSPSDHYHLITRIDSGITTCADLIGKDVLLLEANRAHLTKDWFLVELNKAGLDAGAINTHVVGDISKAMLPVFFKQSDACVVNDDAYELMKELNPQLSRQLKPIMTSPEFTEIVTCLRKGYQTQRKQVIKGLGELHSDVSGRQVMLVFKINRLIPFQSHYLDSVSELLKNQQNAVGIRNMVIPETSRVRPLAHSGQR